MTPRIIQHIILFLSIALLPSAKAQLSVSDLPQCMQQCINSSDDENCSATDIACLCRASSRNFLPNLVTCMRWQCSDSVFSDVSLLLTPLQIACKLAGAPIPSAAIRNAQSIASSLDNQVTTTVTMGGSSTTGSAQATTTVLSLSVTTTTTTTTRDGTTNVLVFPITISRATVTGVPSTVPVTATSGYTSISSGRTVTTTDSRGNSITGIATSSDRVLTTTNLAGSTITTTKGGSSFSTSSHSSSSHSSLTSAAGQGGQSTSATHSGGTSISGTSSRTSSSPAESETNSSPFLNTNNPASRSKVSRSLLGIGILMGLGGYLLV
ncbi:hypothetical protein B0J14DRAFT_582514 [Halenospora varia]|nr:hypothetical protein B0J14DRAFT_582514 [Halenospora varia]